MKNTQKQFFSGVLICVLKTCSKFTGEYSCRNVISITLESNFIEIPLWHGCSPVNLPNIFIIPFLKNISEEVFLDTFCEIS